MAFKKKTWVDRMVEYAGRRKITNVTTMAAQIVDVERAEGVVSEEGTAINAVNMNDLEQRTADAFSAVQQDIEGINSDLGGLDFMEESGKKYVRGADAVWVPLGNNPYIMGSEWIENELLSPSPTTKNRNPAGISQNCFYTLTQPLDITYSKKVIIKIHVTNNTNTTCTFGVGVKSTQPQTYVECVNTPTKTTWSSGILSGNIIQLLEYDVSALSGNYYIFAYSSFPYEVGVFYWKVD